MDSAEFVARLAEAQSSEQLEALRSAAIAEENRFRELFAQARDDWEVPELDDPRQSLVPVFATLEARPECFRYREPPSVPLVFKQELPEWKKDLPAVVDRATFQHQFDLFTEGMLRGLNWDNVFCAGGCVGACLMAIPPEHNARSRDRRAYLHDQAFPGSDVDLFLWGLSEEEANKKVVEIYNTVADNSLFDVRCFRSAYAISIVSQYPFRHVQIVLRLYSSPFEVLAGFDVDSCSIGYDGKDVLMTPRAHLATITRTNTIDMTRRSPTYELRLEKYSKRGFQVAVPGLIRERIDPMIYEKDFSKLFGLPRLLVLEKLGTAESRAWYKEMVRVKRARKVHKQLRRRDHWMNARLQDLPGGGVEASDYSTVFLPWGPDWNAAKCEAVMRTKDRMLNNEYANGFRGYPLHPCFIGTAEEVLKDCCPNEGPLPAHADPELVKHHVRGPVSWIKDNPGRQMIGSFNPITEGDWMEGAMLSEHVSDLIAAACSGDAAKLAAFLSEHPDIDINARDRFGRTPLLVAALVGSADCVKLCLDRGASLTQKMPDGRTALHIAAAYGWEGIVLLVASRAGDQLPALVNAVDERSMTPLYWAIALGQVTLAGLLVDAGAHANVSPTASTSSRFNQNVAATEVQDEHMHPFLFTMHLPALSEELARTAIRLLVKAGARSTELTRTAACILHHVANAGNYDHAVTFLNILFEEDPSYGEFGEVLLNTLDDNGLTPLSVAFQAGNYTVAQLFVERGASMTITQAMIDRAARLKSSKILAGDNSMSRHRMHHRRNPWRHFFEQLAHHMWRSYCNRGQLLAAVKFLRFLIEHGDDPNPVIAIGDLANIHVEETKATTVRLADVLKAYEQMMQTQGNGEDSLPRLLKQLQALKRLLNESSNVDTYQGHYQRQAAIVAMYSTLLEAQNVLRSRNKKADDATAKAVCEGQEAFRSLVREMAEKHPSTANLGGQPTSFYMGAKHIPNDAHATMDLDQLTNALRERWQQQAEADIRCITPDMKSIQCDVYLACSALPSDVQAKYTALFEAAYLGDTQRVLQLCERSTNATPELLMAVCNPMNETPFSIALYRGHAETAAAIVQVAMQQYDSFRSMQEQNKLEAAQQLQGQLRSEAVASGLQTTHRLLAKVDNYALAATHSALAGDAAALLAAAASRTVTSVQHGLDLSASEGNALAQTPPDVLLRVLTTVPLIERPGSRAFRWESDKWLHSLHTQLLDASITFDQFSVEDLVRMVEAEAKRSHPPQMAVPSLSPAVMCIWQRRSDLLLRILEWSKELVRRDMARLPPVEHAYGELEQPFDLLYSKHDELSFAAELLQHHEVLQSLMLTDDVELFETLLKEAGFMFPFHALKIQLGIAEQDLHLEALKEHMNELYPLTGATDAPADAFEVALVTSSGARHTVQVSAAQTVRQVKAAIQARHGYQALHQRLFLDGTHLEDDDRAVGSYPGFEAGACLQLVMRLADMSPPGIAGFPALLHDAVVHGADKILACLVSGRATALLDEYLNTSSTTNNFHARMGRKARDLVASYLASDPVRKHFEKLYEHPVTQLVIDSAELQHAERFKLGEFLLEDWFFANNQAVIGSCISSQDLGALQKLRAIVPDDTWLAMLNDQRSSAFGHAVQLGTSTRFNEEQHVEPIVEMISWLFENGMRLLPPLSLKLGRLPLASHISYARKVVEAIVPLKAVDPAQQVLGYRASLLTLLLSGLEQTVFEALISRVPQGEMQQFVELFTLFNDGCHPVHFLAGLDKKFSGNLTYWLQSDLMAGVDVSRLANSEGSTALHRAASQHKPKAVSILLGTTAEAAEGEALAALSHPAPSTVLHGSIANVEDAHGMTPLDKAASACASEVNQAAQTLHSGGRVDKQARTNYRFAVYLQCLTKLQLAAREPSRAVHVVTGPGTQGSRVDALHDLELSNAARTHGPTGFGLGRKLPPVNSSQFRLPSETISSDPPCIVAANLSRRAFGASGLIF